MDFLILKDNQPYIPINSVNVFKSKDKTKKFSNSMKILTQTDQLRVVKLNLSLVLSKDKYWYDEFIAALKNQKNLQK